METTSCGWWWEARFFQSPDTPKSCFAIHALLSLRIWGVSRVKIATNFPLTSEEQKGDWRSLIPFLKNSNGHGQLCILWSLISQIDHNCHGVWKSQKKSHSILRAKRATFTFWVDKSSLKMPKMVHFGEFFENLKLAVKQSYQTGQF